VRPGREKGSLWKVHKRVERRRVRQEGLREPAGGKRDDRALWEKKAKKKS